MFDHMPKILRATYPFTRSILVVIPYTKLSTEIEVSSSNNVKDISHTYSQSLRVKGHRDVLLSHAHTVVWECCKDDRQCQWGMAKFDTQPTLKPWTDRHQIWNTWLRRGYLSPQTIRAQPAQGVLPPPTPPYTRNIHQKPSHVYFFLSSSKKSTVSLVGPIFTFRVLSGEISTRSRHSPRLASAHH